MDRFDSTQIICSGGLFLARDTKRFMLLLRTRGNTAGTWGLVGGKKEPHDVTPYDILNREIEEEVVHQDEEEHCSPWQISFFNLSYWVLVLKMM
jgi:hypothetical protein